MEGEDGGVVEEGWSGMDIVGDPLVIQYLTYRYKDDLRDIAISLELGDIGTITELITQSRLI